MIVFADDSLASIATALRKVNIEDLLLPVLIQLIVIILVARLFGMLLRKLGQPTVVGEVVAGIAMGPSLFGALFPALSAAVFVPHLDGVPDPITAAMYPKIFSVLSQIGLIFILFLVGLEFEFHHLKQNGRSALLISLIGVIFPFALGAALAPAIHPYLEAHPATGLPVERFGLVLFLGIAMSITALPVLGRMMIEWGINRTQLGAIVITAAAINDAVGWILLASVVALAKAHFDIVDTLKMIGLTIGFSAILFYVARPILIGFFARSLAKSGGTLTLNATAFLIVVMFVCATLTNLIGIFAIFGAFLLGADLSDQDTLREAITNRMRDFVTSFFLPIFFTYTGLRTEIGSLNGTTMWLICGAVILAAIVGKLLGCGLAARMSGFGRKESSLVGIMMNTRGLMELIVINVGYDIGAIPKSLFCMLVLMAVVTTVMTTPLIRLFARGTEIEVPLKQSGFLNK